MSRSAGRPTEEPETIAVVSTTRGRRRGHQRWPRPNCARAAEPVPQPVRGTGRGGSRAEGVTTQPDPHCRSGTSAQPGPVRERRGSTHSARAPPAKAGQGGCRDENAGPEAGHGIREKDKDDEHVHPTRPRCCRSPPAPGAPELPGKFPPGPIRPTVSHTGEYPAGWRAHRGEAPDEEALDLEAPAPGSRSDG